jgi:cobalt-zinc-cadmium efflux system membrane fusion protein
MTDMRTRDIRNYSAFLACLLLMLWAASCSKDTKAAPTRAEVTLEPGVYNVDNAATFKLAKVETRELPSVLNANGSVTPDVNRTIHVTSQGGGKVVDLRVRLGDNVKKGQVLLSIYSSDLASAYSEYQKAVADERLAKKALDRAQLLYAHGAIASKDLEIADDAEEKAQVDVRNTGDHVRLIGGDPSHPSSLIELRAPTSGTIVEQNVAGSEGVKSLDNSPNLFVIADLSEVWVLTDVYENNLGEVHIGDPAEIRLNAYPDKVYAGKVSDLSRVLDPNLRSAKVRIVLSNPDGSLRPGMYAVATFRSRKLNHRMVVPSTALMRLQDRDWLFRKEGPSQFRRVEVHASGETADGLQQIQGGINPGQEIVANALEFSSAVARQGK